MKMVVGDRELEKEKIVLLVMHTLRSNEPVSVAGHGNDVPREDCVESVVVFVVMCYFASSFQSTSPSLFSSS